MNLHLLYLDLLWLNYLDTVEEANHSLLMGDKLSAIGFAIEAHKTKSLFDNALQKYILGI